VPNARGVGKIAFTGQEISVSDALPMVRVHDGALAEEYAVPSTTFAGSRSLMITATVQLTAARLVI